MLKNIVKIRNIILFVLLQCIFIFFALFRNVKYYNLSKGEIGTKKVPYYQIMAENPEKIKVFVIVGILVILITGFIYFKNIGKGR